jgi:glycosyltransferase involved in cell wall biosynthesis
MKIATITATGAGGGAAAALRLNHGLLDLGIDARAFLGCQPVTMPQRGIVYTPSRSWHVRLRRFLRRKLIHNRTTEMRRAVDRIELYSSLWSEHGRDSLAACPSADIYHFHWINGLVDLEAWLPGLPQDAKIVWTLHDMNAFTGGCHYDGGCGRFRIGCGNCPQLAKPTSGDLSRRQFLAKESVLQPYISGNRLRVVAPSVWLTNEARASKLFCDVPVSTIPYGLDSSTFRQLDQQECRNVLGVAPGDVVLIYVCGSLKNYRKGFDLLLETMKHLSQKDSRSFTLLLLGDGKLDQKEILTMGNVKIRTLGRLSDEHLISAAYSAADIHVLPTRADNLPNTVLEAMACGTPSVGFNVGGLPDMIRPGISGELAAPEDSQDLANAIIRMANTTSTIIRQNCRRIVEEEYTLRLQGERYLRIYEALLSPCG